MELRYIKSATVVIEHKGIKVLCDPWLTDGIYYGSWFHWPPLKFSARDFEDVNYIYISHVHPDHCDVASLKDLPKHVPVVIHDYQEKFLLNTLKKLGFQKVIEVGNRQELVLGPDFKMEVLAGDDCNPAMFARSYGHKFKSYPKTMQIDSLAIFNGGGKTLINSNDVPIALINGAFSYILNKYGLIDVLLVSYAGAGPFPQAYAMPEHEKRDFAIGAAYSFLQGTAIYIKLLKPKYFMPYAGQYTLGGALSGLNCYKGTLELDELILDLVPVLKSTVNSEMVLLDSGERFDLATEQASKPFMPTDFIARDKYIRETLSQLKFDYQHDERVTADELLPKLREARETLWAKQEEYGYFSDSEVYIGRGDGTAFRLGFNDKDISIIDKPNLGVSHVSATCDLRLLDRILNRRANWNNAEIGSHFSLYDFIHAPSQSPGRSYDAMPHHMMSYFQRPIRKATENPSAQLATIQEK